MDGIFEDIGQIYFQISIFKKIYSNLVTRNVHQISYLFQLFKTKFGRVYHLSKLVNQVDFWHEEKCFLLVILVCYLDVPGDRKNTSYIKKKKNV